MKIENALSKTVKLELSFGSIEVRKVTFGDFIAIKDWIKAQRISNVVKSFKDNGMGKEAITAAMQISREKISDEEMQESIGTLDGAGFLLNRLTGDDKFIDKISMEDLNIILESVMPETDGESGELAAGKK